MHILIIKLGALGDVINTIPLAIHLKESLNAHITWIVEPLSFPIIDNHTACDRAILFDKKNWKKSLGHVSKLINKEKFDITLDLQRILKSAFFTLKSNSKRKISFDKRRCKEMTWLLPYEKIPAKNQKSRHMLDQYLEFGEYLGVGLPDEIKWDIPDFKIKSLVNQDYVVLNIGATKPANKWFEDSFAKLCDLIFENTDFVPVLTGGMEDVAFSLKIQSMCKFPPINMTGRTTLAELSVLLKESSFIVSCDTGPMHLGVALNKKVVALFGPSNPVRTGPYYGKIIRSLSSECMECNQKRCETRSCMKKIDPSRVFKAIFMEPWHEKSVDFLS